MFLSAEYALIRGPFPQDGELPPVACSANLGVFCLAGKRDESLATRALWPSLNFIAAVDNSDTVEIKLIIEKALQEKKCSVWIIKWMIDFGRLFLAAAVSAWEARLDASSNTLALATRRKNPPLESQFV